MVFCSSDGTTSLDRFMFRKHWAIVPTQARPGNPAIGERRAAEEGPLSCQRAREYAPTIHGLVTGEFASRRLWIARTTNLVCKGNSEPLPGRQPDLHVPCRLRNRQARQDRVHPREVRNGQGRYSNSPRSALVSVARSSGWACAGCRPIIARPAPGTAPSSPRRRIHLPVDVGKPRQESGAVADEEGGVAPVPSTKPPHRPHQHRHRDEPHRRRATSITALTHDCAPQPDTFRLSIVYSTGRTTSATSTASTPTGGGCRRVRQPGVEPVCCMRVVHSDAPHRQRYDVAPDLFPTSCRFTPSPKRTTAIPSQVHAERNHTRRTTRAEVAPNAPTHGRGTRYCLRAAMSNASVITPKTR